MKYTKHQVRLTLLWLVHYGLFKSNLSVSQDSLGRDGILGREEVVVLLKVAHVWRKLQKELRHDNQHPTEPPREIESISKLSQINKTQPDFKKAISWFQFLSLCRCVPFNIHSNWNKKNCHNLHSLKTNTLLEKYRRIKLKIHNLISHSCLR